MQNYLFKLEKVIKRNKSKNIKKSYTAYLFKKGNSYSIKKLSEEFKELSFALNRDNKKNIIHEVADLIYHLMVLIVAKKIKLSQILKELIRRSRLSGIQEKKNRNYVR